MSVLCYCREVPSHIAAASTKKKRGLYSTFKATALTGAEDWPLVFESLEVEMLNYLKGSNLHFFELHLHTHVIGLPQLKAHIHMN